MKRRPARKATDVQIGLPDNTSNDGLTNDQRASWAEAALVVFGQRTGLVKQQVGDNEDAFLVVSDLLTDLAHWCDRNRVDLEAAIRHATKHYQTETRSQGTQLIAGKL